MAKKIPQPLSIDQNTCKIHTIGLMYSNPQNWGMNVKFFYNGLCNPLITTRTKMENFDGWGCGSPHNSIQFFKSSYFTYWNCEGDTNFFNDCTSVVVLALVMYGQKHSKPLKWSTCSILKLSVQWTTSEHAS